MKKYIAITAFMLMSVGVLGQVTIGSDSKPAHGSLLDLKEFDNSTGEANAAKGLLLPRVAISDVTILQIAPETQKSEHMGTIVYAVSEEPEKPEVNANACDSIPLANSQISGVMVWTGTEWQSLLPKEEKSAEDPNLPSWVHPAVKLTKPDHEGNIYTYRYFGDPDHQNITLADFVGNGGNAADYHNYGYWMTENLKSKSFASNYPGVKLSLVRRSGDKTNSLVYGYPQKFNEKDLQLDKDFLSYPNLGLLYSSGAITGAPNGSIVTTPNMQGICPDGWFLPTQSDWGDLIKYLELPEQLAQYTTYATDPQVVEYKTSRTLATACSDFMDTVAVSASRGKVAADGAFGLVAVGWGNVTSGYVQNSKIFEYPETPDTGTASGVLFRAGAAGITDVNSRYHSFLSQPGVLINQMVSVRCRTNVNPESYSLDKSKYKSSSK